MDGSSRLNAAVNSSAISYNAHDGNSCCDRIRYLISKKEKDIKKRKKIKRNKKKSEKEEKKEGKNKNKNKSLTRLQHLMPMHYP